MKIKEFQSHKKQSTGLLGRVSDSLHNMSSSYMLKYRKPEFAAMQDYILAFGEKLANIERITQRIVKEQTGKKFFFMTAFEVYGMETACHV